MTDRLLFTQIDEEKKKLGFIFGKQILYIVYEENTSFAWIF